LIVTEAVARIAAPLCRAEMRAACAGAHGDDARRIVEHLHTAGPSVTKDDERLVRPEAGWLASA
jgi:hypothetical protein